jgi:catechol 2,3-dioxygenase-like lactoylglutathione lyase family enzyme
MSFAHLTLATRDVPRTAAFFEESFGWRRDEVPGNTPVQALWLDIGRGQQIHVLYTEGFEISPFEHEFGRHVAVFHPLAEFPALKERLIARGARIVAPLRSTPFERFFFYEPINGYLFEVIDDTRRAVMEARTF